jgi:hypothetical protein
MGGLGGVGGAFPPTNFARGFCIPALAMDLGVEVNFLGKNCLLKYFNFIVNLDRSL